VIANMRFNSLDCQNGQAMTNSVLAAIPVTVPYGTIQLYQDRTGVVIECSAKVISSISLKLYDEQGFPLLLTGANWSCVIVVESK